MAQLQPPPQSTQQVPSQPTPQTGTGQPQRNPLLATNNPVTVAMKMKNWAQEIQNTYLFWEPNHQRDKQGRITKRGTDSNDFAAMHKDPNSRLSVILNQMGWMADYLETHRKPLPQADKMLRDKVIPLMKNIRGNYNSLGPIKNCANLFAPLMRDVKRSLKELEKIR